MNKQEGSFAAAFSFFGLTLKTFLPTQNKSGGSRAARQTGLTNHG
jgi:hypothetical protein